MALIRFHLISTGSGRPGPGARKSRDGDVFVFFTIKGERVHTEQTQASLLPIHCCVRVDQPLDMFRGPNYM